MIVWAYGYGQNNYHWIPVKQGSTLLLARWPGASKNCFRAIKILKIIILLARSGK